MRETEIEALRRRVEELERLVRPLRPTRTMARHGDDAVLAALADQVGVDIARLQGGERTRAVTAARRVAARILTREVGWSIGRTARSLRKDHRTVREMVG